MNLTVKNLCAGYGSLPVLRGVDFHAESGEVVSLLGRNGSGRSTVCKALMKLLPGQEDFGPDGEVYLGGKSLAKLSTHDIADAGLGYVPEERLIFSILSVEENLLIGSKKGRKGASADLASNEAWNMQNAYELFPRLFERRHVAAGKLSGGEQQMLAIMRTVVGNPAAILLDEPTEGLAPAMIDVIENAIVEMKRRQMAVLLVEQKLSLAYRVADRMLVMGGGRIVFDGTPAQLTDRSDIRKEWLEVG